MAEVSPSEESPSPPPLPVVPPAPMLETPTPPTQPPQPFRSCSPSRKAGRRPKFNTTDDLIIAREVCAAKAHVARYGEIKSRFAHAAEKANNNRQLSQHVTAKSIQDRYKEIQDAFDRKDASDRKLSGVGGEIGELDELLGMMAEARNDVEMEKKAAIEVEEKCNAEKERIGKELVARSLFRKRGSSMDSEEEDENGGNSAVKKRKKSRRRGLDGEGELALFGAALKDADLARLEVEKERLALQRERMAAEKEERAEERALRREEQNGHNELELEKFKLLIDAFTQARK